MSKKTYYSQCIHLTYLCKTTLNFWHIRGTMLIWATKFLKDCTYQNEEQNNHSSLLIKSRTWEKVSRSSLKLYSQPNDNLTGSEI